MRKEILLQAEITPRIRAFIDQMVDLLASSPDSFSDGFEHQLTHIFPFDEPTLDRLFDTPADSFASVLKTEVHELYDAKTAAFGKEIMQKVERDIYLQVLDNLWMQHLENMDHLRGGIRWLGVGQRDPLVEYRRQSQILFDAMQEQLRHDVVQALYSAVPVKDNLLNTPVETELTRAARNSVDNAAEITEAEQYEEEDFSSSHSKKGGTKTAVSKTQKQKQRKAERQRRKKNRR